MGMTGDFGLVTFMIVKKLESVSPVGRSFKVMRVTGTTVYMQDRRW